MEVAGKCLYQCLCITAGLEVAFLVYCFYGDLVKQAQMSVRLYIHRVSKKKHPLILLAIS